MIDNYSNYKELIESLTNYADSHIKELRLSIGVLGLLGAGIALRSIRYATKFTNSQMVPKSFIKKNISLRGIVKQITNDGTLNVEHVPLIRMPWHRNDKLVNVSFAAISPSISGAYWLKLNIENKSIWFKILWRNENNLNCIVSTGKSIVLKDNLNVTLVTKGLALLQPYDYQFNNIKPYRELYKNLIKSETKAQKSKVGVWFEDSKYDLFKNKMYIYLDNLKKIRNVFKLKNT